MGDNTSDPHTMSAKAAVGDLMRRFFACVSFEPGAQPDYDGLRALMLPGGLLVKAVGGVLEVSTVDDFIAPRRALVAGGRLTRFMETELHGRTDVFGNVAQRWSAYAKNGTQDGKPFEALGMITTQCVATPQGWRIASMAWDDEREGLRVPR